MSDISVQPWFAAARTAAVLCVLLALSACNKKADGQVAAVVNGEEITLQELNMATEQQVDGTQPGDVARNAALNAVIDRKLAAQIAKDEAIDQTPEYILREQQAREALAVQMLAQKISRGIPQPKPDDVLRYIAENRQMFADRALLICDQVRFAPSQDARIIDRLRTTKSIAEVIALLNSEGIAFDRSEVAIDTAQLPAATGRAIRALPPGEPFVLPGRGTLSASVISSVRPVPVSDDQAKPAALSAIQRTNLNAELEKRLKAARAKAKIEYQTGFGPSAPAAGATASTAAGKT